MNWLNYKTGLKNVFFRMNADKKKASIAIELTHPDAGIQELFFEQFQEFRLILEDILQEEWDWVLHCNDENGRITSRIVKEIEGVNVFNKQDWPALISFFKPRIISLDEFWSTVKDGFESLK